LLEGIGLISEGDSDLATLNYQDDINAGLERENDMEAAPEEDEPNDGVDSSKHSEKIHMAIKKVFMLFHYFHLLLIKFPASQGGEIYTLKSSTPSALVWRG
jgi:hypothetical protein